MEALGIDLGTSLSSAAIIENEKPTALQVATGGSLRGNSYSIPSSVYISEIDEMLLGQAAENARRKNPAGYYKEFKRELGSLTPLSIGNQQIWPQDLYKEFFKYFKIKAEERLGTRVAKVVVTHPAIFVDFEKEIIRQAAAQAGFPVVELLDEPTAAAIYYSSNARIEIGEKILVYDLGGGTFDVALIRKESEGFSPLALPLGNKRLGGLDFESKIFNNIRQKHGEIVAPFITGQDLNSRRVRCELEDLCLNIKHQLSTASQADSTFMIPGSLDYHEYSLSRRDFQSMIEKEVLSTCELIEQIVKSAGLKMQNIDRVLLVGGSSRIPYVEELIKKTTERPVYRDADPELAVCYGAAIWASRTVEAAQPEPKPKPKPEVELIVRDIIVDMNGSGDYSKIQEAINAAADNQTIIVKPGVYHEKLELNQTVNLIGEAGREKTIVVYDQDIVLQVNGINEGQVEGISFVHSHPDKLREAELLIRNHANAFYPGNSANSFNAKLAVGRYDVVVLNNTSVVFENNCVSNGKSGITVLDGHPFLNNNECTQNIAGIVVKGSAKPILKGNICSQNSKSGIEYLDLAGGIAQDNICQENNFGIQVINKAFPDLHDNRCNTNRTAGISYFDGAGGTACKNTCEKNNKYGIQLSDHANPVLEANQCNGNYNHGIFLINQSKPRIKNNQCCDNRGIGIAYFGNAGGVAEANECKKNQVGIQVIDRANPDLQHNQCKANRAAGIAYSDRAGGSARHNDCRDNPQGVTIQDQAKPILENNQS